MKKILFIINPISGVGKQKKIEKAIEQDLDKELFECHIAYTEYAHHATEICQKAKLEGYEIIVAVGGDGSINDCIKALYGADITLGIIPCGSGNGLARTLGLPLNINEAIKVLNQMNEIKIDTIAVNDRIYASIAGIGFDALIAKKFRQSKSRGFQRYLSLVMKHYPAYEEQDYTIEYEDVDSQQKEIMETKALFITCANSNQFGYNAIIAPSASLTDGYIQVSIVRKIPIIMLGWTIQLLIFRNFERSNYVTTFKTKSVKIINNNTRLINLDGESERMNRDLIFNVSPKNLKVLIPLEDNEKREKQTWDNLFH